MPEPGDYFENEAYLYEEHSPECACSMCRPEEHGPMPEYWSMFGGLHKMDWVYSKRGWLFE